LQVHILRKFRVYISELDFIALSGKVTLVVAIEQERRSSSYRTNTPLLCDSLRCGDKSLMSEVKPRTRSDNLNSHRLDQGSEWQNNSYFPSQSKAEFRAKCRGQE